VGSWQFLAIFCQRKRRLWYALDCGNNDRIFDRCGGHAFLQFPARNPPDDRNGSAGKCRRSLRTNDAKRSSLQNRPDYWPSTRPTMSVYSGTKSAVRAISDGLRQEAGAVAAQFGYLDILVNNVGITAPHDGPTKGRIRSRSG
jgi:hypothetical protein